MRPGHTINSTRAYPVWVIVVAVVLFVLAVAVGGVAVAGLIGKLPRNRWAGVRTEDSLRSEESFALANKVAGPTMLAAAGMLVIGGVASTDHRRSLRRRSRDHRRRRRRPHCRFRVEASARAQPPHSRSRADAVTTATAADTPSLSPNRWRRPPRPRRTLPLAVPLPAVPARSRMLASRLIDSRETSP